LKEVLKMNDALRLQSSRVLDIVGGSVMSTVLILGCGLQFRVIS